MADTLQLMQQVDGRLVAVGDEGKNSRPLRIEIVGGSSCTCGEDFEKRLADLEAEVAGMQKTVKRVAAGSVDIKVKPSTEDFSKAVSEEIDKVATRVASRATKAR